MATTSAQKQLTLRKYQAKALREVIGTKGDCLLSQPTGSGKTTSCVALLASQIGKRFTHAIVATPQCQIERGFRALLGVTIHWPDTHELTEVGEEFIRWSREDNAASGKEILAYLNTKRPGYVLSCTHGALVTLFKSDQLRLPKLNKALLVVDECHRVGADGLSGVVRDWKGAGGQLLFLSATPGGRGDGRNPIPEGMRVIERPMPIHMQEGYAPKSFLNAVVPYGLPPRKIKASDLTGDSIAGGAEGKVLQRRLAKSMVKAWNNDGRPFAIFRIPPIRGGSQELGKVIKTELKKANARVLDLMGVGKQRQEECLASLDQERTATPKTAQYDVVLGCMRVAEGTDWPLCSHVYSVGVPGSIVSAIQLIGRAMRKKPVSHPSQNIAKVTFFVPGDEDTDRYEGVTLKHSRHALHVAVTMADWRCHSELALQRTVDETWPGLAPSSLDKESRSEILAELATAIRENPVATVEEARAALAVRRPDLKPAEVNEVLAELVFAHKQEQADWAINEPGEKVVLSGMPAMPNLSRDDAMASIVEQFREETLGESRLLNDVALQVHSLAGGDMCRFTERLRAGAGRPLTEEMIVGWVREHFERTGKYPTQLGGAIIGTSENWGAIASALQSGRRGLLGGESLSRLIKRHFGYARYGNPLTVEWIVDRVKDYFERTGKFPLQQQNGCIPGTNQKWSTINHALRVGIRGLPGGDSLAKLIEREFGYVRRIHSDLSIASIVARITEHVTKAGAYPSLRSGDIPGTNDTWGKVNAALRFGYRGLPGGDSLKKLIEREFGYTLFGGQLAVEWILDRITEHFERTGKYPTQKSGPIRGTGETWCAINGALRAGTRGLPGGDSLPGLIKREFSYSRYGDPVTQEWIIERIKEHYERTGKYPNTRSGVIPGTKDTWSATNTALTVGGRGLPGGDSLARLIYREFGHVPRLRKTLQSV